MTLAIGAKYPWGDLNKLPPIGTKISEAVILVSDSRFSGKLSSGYVTLSDSGMKLFPGKDFAAVYAGISKVGELCLDELKWRLSKQKPSYSARSREIAQKTFQSVYRHQIASLKLSPDDAPLYILIGACDKRGQAELYLFEYCTGFIPEPITGLKALGWQNTARKFYNILENELQKRVEDELSLRTRYPQVPMASWVPMPIKAEEVAILISAILNSLIESGSDTTIGGPVQCALITTTGVILPDISYSIAPAKPHPKWTRVTAKPEELKTVTGKFGAYNLSD